MANLEKIASQVRDAITSDDESVWLDLPQIMNVARPALSAFFAEKLKNPQIRSMFKTETLEFSIEAGEALLAPLNRPYIASIIEELEIFVGSYPYPARVVKAREQLKGESILDALYLKCFCENGTLQFADDSTGQFGNSKINAEATVTAPRVVLKVESLPELLEGEFVMFFADFVKDQILKRA